MKKTFIYIIFANLLYGMEPDEHWISTRRIVELLKTNMFQRTTVYFNNEATKTKDPSRLKINISEPIHLFFKYGNNTKQLLQRIRNEQWAAIFSTQVSQNKKYNIALETAEEWKQRSNKNKRNLHFLPLETKEENKDIFNYQVFFNLLNNAIKEDNDNSESLLKISVKVNEQPYINAYDTLPDHLKKLVKIYPEDIKLLKNELAKNDNKEYYEIQEQRHLQEKKETEEKKRKEIEAFINKKREALREENSNNTKNLIISVLEKLIEEEFSHPVREKFKNKKNMIITRYNLSFLDNKNIHIGKHTKEYLTGKHNNDYIDIFDFIRSLITAIIDDSQNPDTIRSIKNTWNAPFTIALLPSREAYMVQFEFFTIDNKTKKEMDLAYDYSYSRDELEELAKMQKIKHNKLQPYIEEILKKT